MKFIPDLVTSRIHAKIKEIAIGDLIELCQTPIEYNELGISKAIKAMVEETNKPIELWTAQERYAAVLHYFLNNYTENGNAVIDEEIGSTIQDYLTDIDYPVKLRKNINETDKSEQLHYSFVLDKESDNPDYLWMLPLTSAWMEAIERVILGGYVKNVTSQTEVWRITLAAAQIQPKGITLETAIAKSDVSIDQYIINNVNLILSLPESHYYQLMKEFEKGQKKLDHIVILRAYADGFALEAKGGDGVIPPYRFQFDALINTETSELWARNESSRHGDAN